MPLHVQLCAIYKVIRLFLKQNMQTRQVLHPAGALPFKAISFPGHDCLLVMQFLIHNLRVT